MVNTDAHGMPMALQRTQQMRRLVAKPPPCHFTGVSLDSTTTPPQGSTVHRWESRVRYADCSHVHMHNTAFLTLAEEARAMAATESSTGQFGTPVNHRVNHCVLTFLRGSNAGDNLVIETWVNVDGSIQHNCLVENVLVAHVVQSIAPIMDRGKIVRPLTAGSRL